jgi:iron complex transport system substrate-binding protein
LLLITSFASHRWTSFVLALLLAITFCQCSRPANQPANTASTRQFTDDVGRHVGLPSQVERAVSLAPNLTEIVFAIGAGKKLVGVTTYCDYPTEAKSLEKVGDTLNPSLERIIALKPQLVLVSTASQLENFTSQLDSHGIVVFVTDPHDLEGVFHSIQQLGELLNNQNEASELVKRLRSRTEAVEIAVKRLPPVKLFYQLSDKPLYTAGRDSFVTDLIQRAGGESVTANVAGAWPRYSAESALAARPDAIILPTGDASESGNSEVAVPLSRSPAALNGRVYKINADHLSRPGPRAVDGLEEMARALHPEAFK